MKQTAVGIDIRKSSMKIASIDRRGEILVLKNYPYSDDITVPKLLDLIEVGFTELKKQITSDVLIRGVGVSAPNGNYFKGTIDNPPNLPFKGIIPMEEYLRERLNQRLVLISNDANAAALGELIYGGAKGLSHFVSITARQGLGSGIVINRDILLGVDGYAGELGHIKMPGSQRQCSCGQVGCLETYISNQGVCRTALSLLAENQQVSELRQWTPHNIDLIKILGAAKRHDAIATDALRKTFCLLGKTLADVTALFRPEKIFLQGQMFSRLEAFMPDLHQAYEKNLFSGAPGPTEILVSQLPLNHAEILGASALVWKELGY